MYRVGTIAGLFDDYGPLPVDPSWLPPELRGRSVLPDGTPIVPVPRPAPSEVQAQPDRWSAPVLVAIGGAAGLALGFVIFGR